MGRKFRRTYMVGDGVDVEIQKVDALRHQIDLAVLQPEDFEQVEEGAADGAADDDADDAPGDTDEG